MEILDAEYLAEARATDARYHTAKLTAWAVWDPDKLHAEHADWRADVLEGRVAPDISTDELWQATTAVHERMKVVGIIPPNHGAN